VLLLLWMWWCGSEKIVLELMNQSAVSRFHASSILYFQSCHLYSSSSSNATATQSSESSLMTQFFRFLLRKARRTTHVMRRRGETTCYSVHFVSFLVLNVVVVIIIVVISSLSSLAFIDQIGRHYSFLYQ
jgi:hypothetical protein